MSDELRTAAQSLVDALEYHPGSALGGKVALLVAALSVAPHPGENHEFRTTCRRCGESGFLHVAVITDRETVTIAERTP